jgi:hypothetical protein
MLKRRKDSDFSELECENRKYVFCEVEHSQPLINLNSLKENKEEEEEEN